MNPESRDQLTLREARDRYFADNRFGADGGYNKRWERVKVGPIPVYVPNTDGRVRAVRFHDLHHMLTGYATDILGEFEIAAWELASGCADQPFAWVINLGGLVAGMVAQPGRTFRAFVRGRRSRNLFRAAYDAALLDRRLGEVRRELGLDAAPAPARLGDGLGLLVHLLLAVPVSLGWLVALLGMAPFALATAHLPRKEAVVLP